MYRHIYTMYGSVQMYGKYFGTNMGTYMGKRWQDLWRTSWQTLWGIYKISRGEQMAKYMGNRWKCVKNTWENQWKDMGHISKLNNF